MKPIALRKAKIVYNFGLSECKGLKYFGFIFFLAKHQSCNILISPHLPEKTNLWIRGKLPDICNFLMKESAPKMHSRTIFSTFLDIPSLFLLLLYHK